MPDARKRINSLLYDERTTYRTDYQIVPFREYPKTVYQPKKSRYVRGQPAYRNVHTLSEWKGPMPPFNALLKPKDILQTRPSVVQQPYEKPIDTDREMAQKIRPRLVMTPAVSMDDIADSRARDILCTDMYTSDMSRATKEAVAPYTNVRAPFPGLPAPANPIVLPKLQSPLVSPEWRMESVAWDGRQLRSYCDVSRDFWLSHALPRCRACDETKIVKDHRDNLRKIKRGK
ncbi:unnamed protein product [Pieris macdunnoughi]|uniref:Uncharacterized protein n=1 Tax=Pieris macdunnoughi TaxID=345717 RepID=A0A821UXJ8_9NEOP|nr:unnamed protein product [Pieris macdunnoughi]